MYTFWMRQYLLASQTGIELLSQLCEEWSKGIAQLSRIAYGLPISDEHVEEAWIGPVFDPPPGSRSHVGACVASLYSRYGVRPGGKAANAEVWAA